MKNFKNKIRTIVSGVLAIVSLSTCVSAAVIDYGAEYENMVPKTYNEQFSDVSSNHWAFNYISELTDRNIINGYDDGTYRPDDSITRSEFSRILAGAFNAVKRSGVNYLDVQDNAWYKNYVDVAGPYFTAYIDSDGDKYFKPDKKVLREDVAVALVNIKGYKLSDSIDSVINKFSDIDSISNKTIKYVATGLDRGILSGYENGTFRGQNVVTRAEAAAMIWRAYQYGSDNKITGTNNGIDVDIPIITDSPTTTPTTEPTSTPNPTEEPIPTDEPIETPEPTEEPMIPKITDTSIGTTPLNSLEAYSANGMMNDIFVLDFDTPDKQYLRRFALSGKIGKNYASDFNVNIIAMDYLTSMGAMIADNGDIYTISSSSYEKANVIESSDVTAEEFANYVASVKDTYMNRMYRPYTGNNFKYGKYNVNLVSDTEVEISTNGLEVEMDPEQDYFMVSNDYNNYYYQNRTITRVDSQGTTTIDMSDKLTESDYVVDYDGGYFYMVHFNNDGVEEFIRANVSSGDIENYGETTVMDKINYYKNQGKFFLPKISSNSLKYFNFEDKNIYKLSFGY